MGTTKKPSTIKTNPGDSVWDRVRKFVQAAILENARIYRGLLEATGQLSVGMAFQRLANRINDIPEDIRKTGIDGISGLEANSDGVFYFEYKGVGRRVPFREDSGWRTGYIKVPDGVESDIYALRDIEKQLNEDKEILEQRAFVVDRVIPAIGHLELRVADERARIVERLRRDDILPIGC